MNRMTNCSDEFWELTQEDQERAIMWIKENIQPRKTPNERHTSYGIKHLFEHVVGGFYMTNGEFKGAMSAAGFEPVLKGDLNWSYRVSNKSPAFKNGYGR